MTITSRHRIASSRTPREGSLKPGASSPSAAEPSPIRGVHVSTTTSSSAEDSATVIRGSTLSAAIPAAKPAPNTPPSDQPACSEDMIGRPRSRSTLTPCAFIETSIVAFEAPSTNSASGTSSGFGARITRLTASTSARPPSQVIRTEPCRTMNWPATGKARMTATDIPIRTSPISLFVRSKRSWIDGICATNVPITAPLTKNIAVVAQRRLMRASP